VGPGPAGWVNPPSCLAHLHRDEAPASRALQALEPQGSALGSHRGAIAIPWVEQRLAWSSPPSQKGAVEAGPLQQGAGDHRWAGGGQRPPGSNANPGIMARPRSYGILLCDSTRPGRQRMGETPLEAKTTPRLLERFDSGSPYRVQAQGRAAAECDHAWWWDEPSHGEM